MSRSTEADLGKGSVFDPEPGASQAPSVARFTPAPWEACDNNIVIHDSDRPYRLISTAYPGCDYETGKGWVDRTALAEAEANARLIAAGPDLYAALERLHDNIAEYARINNLGGFDNQDMQQARAALAKARGETK